MNNPEQEHEKELVEEFLGMLCKQQKGGQESPSGQTADAQDRAAAVSFAHFMDRMPGGFLIYCADRGEQIIYANRSLLRIFGCDTLEEFRQLTGNSFRGIVHPDELEAVEESIWKQIRSSQYDLDYVEYRIRRKDGKLRWIEDYGHFVHTTSLGDIFYVFMGDATEKHDQMLHERRILLNESLEKEQKLKNLIEEYDREYSLINQKYLRQLEVIDGLSINYEAISYVDLDEDQIVPYRLSSRTKELFDGDLAPKSYSWYIENYIVAWVHPEDQEMVFKMMSPEYIREKLADTQTFYFNYRVLADGVLQYIQLRAVNVGKPDGNFQIVLGSRRVDEEIQQQMEQQALLAEALAKANLAINSKNAFLSNMSHDMRTPLHAIFGFTSLAKLNLDDPCEAMDYLDRVETASRELLDMIEKVLEVSALSGSAELENVECDIRDTVQQVYDFLKPQAEEKDISFILDYRGVRHSGIYSDPQKLRQLMLYLANNAITYTNPGGRVIITITEGEELPNHCAVYQLSVKDNGIGISPEYLDRIFEPFSREKNSTLSGVHGIGLGLTIAKSIADLMGGNITIQSELGIGSTFTATMSFQMQPRSQLSQEGGEGSLRILLVEGNDLNREIELELLQKLGFRIDAAESGQEALAKLRGSAPDTYDLILLELQMPVMSGWQAAREIRALPDPAVAELPIIALSSNGLESDRKRLQECGINAYLMKPMDMALLLQTIERITGVSCSS